MGLNNISRVIMGMMIILMMMMMVGVVRSDITSEKNECADQLMGLIPCLGYVGGTGNAPTPNCCTGLKQVMQKSKKCICILVKDKDEAETLHFKINVTRALSLPTVCHSPANVSNCPAILNLAPNSPEAKVFEDFAHGQNNNSTTTAAATTVPTNPATTTPASSSASPDSAAAAHKNKPAAHLAMAACITLTAHLIHYYYF